MSVRRVQVYAGDGECVLDVGVVDQVNADWLTDYLRGTVDGDVYDDEMPSLDPRSDNALRAALRRARSDILAAYAGDPAKWPNHNETIAVIDAALEKT